MDEDASVEVAGKEKRVALGGPGLLDHVDIGQRIEARAHCPQHLVEVTGIDVLVDHHRPFAGVSAALARGDNVERLAGMAGISLPILDGGEAELVAASVLPHAPLRRYY